MVTGVNIPMLTETFMARDNNPYFQNVVCTAIETSSICVKLLKTTEQETG